MQTIDGGNDREVRGLEVRSSNTFEETRNDQRDCDGASGHGNAGNGACDNRPDGRSRRHADGPTVDDGSAVQNQDGEMHWWHEDDMQVRRRHVGHDAAKSLLDDGRQHVQLLHDDERHDDVLLQHGYVHVQV
jgi:hypothetical protein